MSFAKDMIAHGEYLRFRANEALLRADVVVPCNIHPGVHTRKYITDDETKRAYAIGTNMIKSKEINAGREELMAKIKEVFDDLPDECPFCEREGY